jgi:hypothetical protein
MTNKQFRQPKFPLPPPLMMSQEGSFAHMTLTQRMPKIVERVIAENNFSSEIVENLETLIQELPNGIVRQLTDEIAPDFSDWLRYIEPFLGKRWIEIPWFFAEAYFYRRILEATQYFLPGLSQGVDCFALQKRRGLETAIASIQSLTTKVNFWFNSQQQRDDILIALLYFSLWGNRADLSLWPINSGETNPQGNLTPPTPLPYKGRGEHDSPLLLGEGLGERLLVDDTDKIISHIKGRIDFIIDNAGFELVCDLCLADFLLSSNVAEIIYLHLKLHPTFVSDAMIQDVRDTLEFLSADSNPEVQLLGKRLQEHIEQGRLLCCEKQFWTSPLAFWKMPEELQNELEKSQLILIKGDANYRRCLGDLQWQFPTPFQDIVCYFPAPVAALRTLKSEIAAGLQPNQISILNQTDSQWLTNGQWGVIQLVT